MEQQRGINWAVNRAKLMQRLSALSTQRGLAGGRRAVVGQERRVDTRHGSVRVLEYGFGSPMKQPLFIDLHGGGFVFQRAEDDEEIILSLLEHTPQLKVIAMDYPKAPDHPYPQAIEAIEDALRYYLDRAEELGIDRNRVGIGGHSAGANLATALCLRDLEQNQFGFHYQILDYPVLDLATDPEEKQLRVGGIHASEARMYNTCYVRPEQARELAVSPALARPEDLQGMPPALIVVCGLDSLYEEGVAYARTLEQAGTPVELAEYMGQGHGFTHQDPRGKDGQDVICRMARFIRAQNGQ